MACELASGSPMTDAAQGSLTASREWFLVASVTLQVQAKVPKKIENKDKRELSSKRV